MGRIRRFATVVYALCCVAVLGSFGALLVDPALIARIDQLLGTMAYRVTMGACVAVMALYALAALVRALFARREPASVHPGGDPHIEVTVGALRSVARAAAEQDDLVMIESVDARVRGRDASEVRFKIDAIALSDQDLFGRARRMQERVEAACNAMLGIEGAAARVRFLPSKTTVTVATREVFDE